MLKLGINAAEAKKRIKAANGNLRRALGERLKERELNAEAQRTQGQNG
jgi:hypothetical protein